MLDFLKVSVREKKKDLIEIHPRFIVKRSSDLMIRGGDFYAIWIEDKKLWSTDEQDALDLIDDAIKKFSKEYREEHKDDGVRFTTSYLWDSSSGMIDSWHKYCQKQMRDNFHPLDENIIFSNHDTKKEDYASKKLSYPLEAGDHSSFDRLMSVLYSPEERHKIEWAIGAIVSGDSKTIQKFLVFYGDPGTGKSTVLNIIQKLFDGYCGVFDAKALGSSNNSFALEAFKSNPLVAIQHDGNLSRIEDNTRLNSLVSHEYMTVNEKFKSAYTNKFNAFLFLGTNDPVKITNAKSGLIRRLIDVTPTGNKIPSKEYRTLVNRIDFELGAIADYCLNVYLSDPGKYDDYVPLDMLGASNDFYNFVIDSYPIFKKEDGVSLKAAWEMYKTYCDDAKVPYPFSQRVFKEELKNYFREYTDRFNVGDGTRVRSYYAGFKTEKFDRHINNEHSYKENSNTLMDFDGIESAFDKEFSECQAQYAGKNEAPIKGWDNVKTKLKDIDTSKLHYIRPPKNLIVIDFDIKDRDGNKNFEKNAEEASKWPPTYAEVSKSGAGIHLHYYYDGDVSKLSRVYDDQIEVKVFTGKSSLRRCLSKFNSLPIATISSGLPLKGDKKVINFKSVTDEKHLRVMIKKNLNKECHPSTKCSVDFIYKLLTDAYNSGIKYDVSDLRTSVVAFAAGSTNQSDTCLKLVNKMPFKSEEPSESISNEEAPLIFFDVEVFPNLFLVEWKVQGNDRSVVRMFNPKPSDIEELFKFRLVGFNCRRYDNHMLYGCYIGYDNQQLYELSQRIISGDRNAFFGEAYNISYTDIYDFSSTKQSLKKFEIDLGIHHKELGLPWDKPVPKNRWEEVAEYCENDVLATEAVFNARRGDFAARQILARLAGGTVNDTTNSLSAKIIFGNNRHPQDQFNYRYMGDSSVKTTRTIVIGDTVFNEFGDEYTVFDELRRPIFPGYEFKNGKSTYRGEEVGEGGCVYAEPGMYTDVALLDIASMHPSSIIAEQLFGPLYTKRFEDLKEARVAVKHHDWDRARKLLDGILTPYIDELENGTAWFTADDLAYALKIVINSIYGLTAANFDNPFRDKRNIDNIVAKRGALFMINLKHVVQDQGFTVAHIKTDSIKIPNATPEIIKFVMDYGQQYGYTFEHEATYKRMCLVNKSTYIAQYPDGTWTATGTQFQVPYVFKTLFSKEPIEFDDMCETKSVKTAIYLDMNEGSPDEHDYHFVGKVGRFTPILPGHNGGELLRENVDKNGNVKYDAVVGSSGYRWLESEMVKTLGKEDSIDRSYYNKLVDDAVTEISKYGDFEWFVNG